MSTPIGNVEVCVEQGYVTGLRFTDKEESQYDLDGLLMDVRIQLGLYFQCKLLTFDVPAAFGGSPYQHKVWQEVNKIPFGETKTYADIARVIGETHPRAIGSAIAANPILILMPCHRVISSSGDLAGYAGGLERKRQLLALEANASVGRQVHLFE